MAREEDKFGARVMAVGASALLNQGNGRIDKLKKDARELEKFMLEMLAEEDDDDED